MSELRVMVGTIVFDAFDAVLVGNSLGESEGVRFCTVFVFWSNESVRDDDKSRVSLPEGVLEFVASLDADARLCEYVEVGVDDDDRDLDRSCDIVNVDDGVDVFVPTETSAD